MVNEIILFYGILGSTASLRPYFDKIRHKFTEVATHEKVIFQCYKKAIKDVTGRDLSQFRLSGEIVLFQDAINFLENDDFEAGTKCIDKFFATSDIDYSKVKQRFSYHLAESGSSQVLILITMKILDKTRELHKDITTILQKLSQEPDLRETLDISIEHVNYLIDDGHLVKAHKLIRTVLNVDELLGLNDYKEKLYLLESKLVLMLGLKGEVEIQIKKLAKLRPSFEKFYYVLRFKEHPKFDINRFIQEYNADSYQIELQICHNLLNGLGYTFDENQLLKCDENAKSKIVKLQLLNYVNTNNPSEGIKLTERYSDYLADRESRLLILVNKINQLLKGKILCELTLGDLNQLESLESEFTRIENYYREHNSSIKAAFYFNFAFVRFLMNKPEWKDCLDYFKNIDELVTRFLNIVKLCGKYELALQILDSLESTKTSPHLLSEYIEINKFLGNFQEIAKLDLDKIELPEEIVIQAINAKNIALYHEKENEFCEDDITYFEKNKESIFVYCTIANIFHNQKNEQLRGKYFNLALDRLDKATDKEKLYLAKTAELIGEIEIPQSLYQELVASDPNPNHKFHYAKFLLNQENLIDVYSKELQELFNSIKLDDTGVFLDLIRAKIQYFLQHREIDKAIKLAKHIAENFDNDSDWYNYISVLIDSGKVDAAIDYVPHLEKKSNSPLILLTLGIISLYKSSSARLEEFTKYFLLAHLKLTKPITRFEDFILTKIWFHIIINNLHDAEKCDFVKENVLVLLRNKNTNQTMNLCIHSDHSYVIPFDEEYGDSKHLHKDDPLIQTLKFKKINDKALLNEEAYIIEKIESLWNYPTIYMGKIFYADPQKYGARVITVDPDPVTNLIPVLSEQKKFGERRIEAYNRGELISLYLISDRSYERYISTLLHLFEQQRSIFRAGIGVKVDRNRQCTISVSSLFLLETLNKLQFLPLENLIIAQTLLDEVDRIIFEYTENITNEGLSVGLDDSGILTKLEMDKEFNLNRAKGWDTFRNRLSNMKTIDTSDIEDNYTTHITYFGKLEVDSIRVAASQQTPLIIDDEVIQKAFKFKNVTNVIPFYFHNSSEGLLDRLQFLNQLSKYKYRYVVFMGLIKELTEIFIRENQTLIGSNTTLGTFLELMKREMYVRYPHLNLFQEFYSGFQTLILNRLNPASFIIFQSILGISPEEDKVRFKNDLNLDNITDESKLSFIRSCFDSK